MAKSHTQYAIMWQMLSKLDFLLGAKIFLHPISNESNHKHCKKIKSKLLKVINSMTNQQCGSIAKRMN
jgi:hypothetical protein